MTQVYRQKPGIPARNVEGVMAVITPHSSEIHQLNAVGAVIWEACSDGATHAQLLGTLMEHYEVSLEVATADLDHFLAEATQKGILVIST